jgi:hypothetical protein
VVAGGIHDDIIRSHFRYRDGSAVEHQLHLDNGGMSAATGLQNHVG